MSYWLKMIGRFHAPVDLAFEGEDFVAFPDNGVPRINVGDRMVLYAVFHHLLFAIARVTSPPYDHRQQHPDRWGRYSVDVEYLHNGAVGDGVHGNAFVPPFVGNQFGYLEITCQRYNQAAQALGVPPDNC